MKNYYYLLILILIAACTKNQEALNNVYSQKKSEHRTERPLNQEILHVLAQGNDDSSYLNVVVYNGSDEALTSWDLDTFDYEPIKYNYSRSFTNPGPEIECCKLATYTDLDQNCETEPFNLIISEVGLQYKENIHDQFINYDIDQIDGLTFTDFYEGEQHSWAYYEDTDCGDPIGSYGVGLFWPNGFVDCGYYRAIYTKGFYHNSNNQRVVCNTVTDTVISYN
jgi:hypothetical protein